MVQSLEGEWILALVAHKAWVQLQTCTEAAGVASHNNESSDVRRGWVHASQLYQV